MPPISNETAFKFLTQIKFGRTHPTPSRVGTRQRKRVAQGGWRRVQGSPHPIFRENPDGDRNLHDDTLVWGAATL